MQDERYQEIGRAVITAGRGWKLSYDLVHADDKYKVWREGNYWAWMAAEQRHHHLMHSQGMVRQIYRTLEPYLIQQGVSEQDLLDYFEESVHRYKAGEPIWEWQNLEIPDTW